MQSQFLTKNERALVEVLKESPKQYTEIIDVLKKKGVKRSTANNLLKKMQGKKTIFRVEINGNVFYKLNIFPDKIHFFFQLAEKLADVWHMPEWLEMKNEVIRYYPIESFERIIRRWRERFTLSDRKKYKGTIKFLKDFEGDGYEHPFG